MDESNLMHEFLWSLEGVLFFACLLAGGFFLYDWYSRAVNAWPRERLGHIQNTMFLLPAVMLLTVFSVLITLAAPDVVTSPSYISFYLLMGASLIMLSNTGMSLFLDISWKDDLINLGNKAALFPVAGGMISAAIMYSAMNIGDGDGWWCVVVPYAMCWGLWMLLAAIICSFAKVSERITVCRDKYCGARFSVYLIVSSLLIARANAGDWISFEATVFEFMDSAPVLILAAAAFLIEFIYMRMAAKEIRAKAARSLAVSALYIAITVILWNFMMPDMSINSLR